MRTHSTPNRTNLLAAFAGTSALGALLIVALQADRTLFLALNHGLAVVPDPLLGGLALLGLGLSALLLLSPALVVAARLFGAAVYAAPVGLALTHLPKEALHIARPLAVLNPSQVHVVGVALRGANAWPSGHALTALALATILILGSERVARTRWRSGTLLALATAVCLARIAVGAHWPSDVLGGAALGVATGWLGLRAADRWPLWRHPAGQAALAAVILGCAAAMALEPAELPQVEPLRIVLALVGLGSVAAWTSSALRTWCCR
jgi:undecaprenyl-diphosphatase